ncbi:MAG: hypothetical protein ACRD0B_03500 [Acidimicrobiales bacterium]
MSHLVLFDNEAVQALSAPEHAKHRRVLAHVDVLAGRKMRGRPVRLAVPTAVRVEAGWDRTDPRWALANRLGLSDLPLDRLAADRAAGIRGALGVSVADAHLGAAMDAADEDQVTVLSSDPADMQRVCGTKDVVVVTV